MTSSSNINNISAASSSTYQSAAGVYGSREFGNTEAAPVEEEVVSEFEKKLTKEQADQFAADLKKSLNTAAGTRVSFDVSIKQDDSNGVKFQVIDENSGEVVREFPQESIFSAAHNTDGKGSGLLIKKVA